MDRVLTVDALRGVAIVLMLLQHAPLYLLGGFEDSYFYALAVVASRLSAPLFFLLAGYSVYLSGRRRVAAKGKSSFIGHACWRFLELFALGVLVNAFKSEGLLFLNVLQVIALMVFFASLVYVSGLAAYFTVLALLGVYCLLGPSVVSHVNVDSPASFVVWVMASGEYAFGPWFLYALVGLGVGMLPGGVRLGRVYLFYSGWFLVLSGMLLVPLGYASPLQNNAPPVVLILLGFMLVAYWLVGLMREWSVTNGVVETLAVYGRHSLALYVGQQFLFGFVSRAFGVRNAFSLPTVLAAFASFLVVSYAAARLYESSR